MRRLRRLAAVSALAAMGAACGSSSPAGVSATTRARGSANGHAAFVRAVNAECSRAVAAHAGHPFPLENFDPERPDPNQLPTVADYFAKYGGLPQIRASLHAENPPRSDIGAWRSLLDIVDNITSNGQRQIAAARARDATTFVDTIRTGNRLANDINRAGERFGFHEGSPCRRVFG